MATCKLCARNGIFLSVNNYGLCNICNTQMITEAKLLLPQINQNMKKADDEPNLKTRVRFCERAIQLSENLLKYEKLGIPIIKPLPSLIIKTYSENKAKYLNEIAKVKPPSQMFIEYPKGICMLLLMHYEHPSRDFEKTNKYYKEASKIEDVIVDKNIKAKELEAESKIDEAIQIYESNIADFVDTPAPYDRLRIIYTKRKQYAEAIRVCESFIEMCKRSSQAVLLELGDKEFADQLLDTGKFEDHISKLKAKLNS